MLQLTKARGACKCSWNGEEWQWKTDVGRYGSIDLSDPAGTRERQESVLALLKAARELDDTVIGASKDYDSTYYVHFPGGWDDEMPDLGIEADVTIKYMPLPMEKQAGGLGMKIGALLTIHVEYTVPEDWSLEQTRDEILGQLDCAAQHLADSGLLTGERDLEVERWWNKQAIIVGPEEDAGDSRRTLCVVEEGPDGIHVRPVSGLLRSTHRQRG